MITPPAKLKGIIGEILATRLKFSSRVVAIWLLCHAHDVHEFTPEVLVKSLSMSIGCVDSVLWDLLEAGLVQRFVENEVQSKNKFELKPAVRFRALAEAQK
jgi:hypothetical protein